MSGPSFAKAAQQMEETVRNLAYLLRAVDSSDRVLILTHNDPDPDAIASVGALGFLLQQVRNLRVTIAYRGMIGRAENKALWSTSTVRCVGWRLKISRKRFLSLSWVAFVLSMSRKERSIPMEPEKRIRRLLALLYGEEAAARAWSQLSTQVETFAALHPHLRTDLPPADDRLTARDAILITYGDQFAEQGQSPLATLHDFLNAHLADTLSSVHILPCFPYSSDDGFSVIDYMEIDPNLGTWEDIAALGQDYRLMFDAVINHISRQSPWFQGFRRDEEPYAGYFITVDPTADLSMVVRPRALPLLTAIQTPSGTKHVWTTFSDDQIDLNYANPQVALEIVDVLLHYVAHGAEIIRLDAIAYLWKEMGTSCIHLPQTHAMVKLWRAVLDAVAPGVILITETNVPHEENISYFGEPLAETGSTDEAQMVYNFSLAPLALHALQTGDATRLSRWADTLQPPSLAATFFNFIASHDGIGVRPAEGILSPAELQGLVDQTLSHGGHVSYKANPDGSKSVYELNITLYDFLNDPNHPQPEVDVHRFLASQVILLSLAGIPGIFVHSLFGSRNCHECVDSTGRARSINRRKFRRQDLEAILSDPKSHQSRAFRGYRHLLRERRIQPAFHPAGRQRVLHLNPGVFALLRTPVDGDSPILCLVNVSAIPQSLILDLGDLGLPISTVWRDLIGGRGFEGVTGRLALRLVGYQSMWLAPEVFH